jgi:hypothetical protein
MAASHATLNLLLESISKKLCPIIGEEIDFVGSS